jgi:exodeoxyribonuclease VII small subunit
MPARPPSTGGPPGGGPPIGGHAARRPEAGDANAAVTRASGSTEHVAGVDELDALTYEELVGMLEDLTERLSSGDVGIEEATDLYEAASAVHAAASERLDRVRARIEAVAEETSGD